MSGVLSIFQRSETSRKACYTQYLGDGDSKGFLTIKEAKVYGDTEVEKLEFVGHVQKRMGTRLRNILKMSKGIKLSDGKNISGRGRLTLKEVDSIQHYYGLAIRKNLSSVEDMKRAIWAIYFHKLSTEDNPQHALCPLEKDLLKKCLRGRTQNPNESFNKCIWERIPKTVFVGIETLKFGVMDAVICFNDGYLEVSDELGIAQSAISRLFQRLQNDATGTIVSRQTVYRGLRDIGLYARRPVRCIPLTATNCRLQLTWSREHALWTPQQWSCVMFSDESRFSLQSDSRRTLIWRAPGTRYHQRNTIERHRYGGAGWLFWGLIILGSRTDLHVQSVTMTGRIYRDVILEQQARLLQGAVCAEFLFIDDNSRPHRANIVDECLYSEDITRMDWPAYSPDMNPIEHVWDILGRRIAAREPPSTCLPEIRTALLDEWCNISQDQKDNLILRMPRHCKKLLGAVTTRRYPRTENRVWSDQEDHEERGLKDRAASTYGPHSDSLNGTRRRSVAIVPQRISRYLAEANFKSSAVSVHSL
ncbi:transposable element Tcb2 transposase [Trichonephila clavipes]|nr:transposable element Tcb2 transposase [Trichonephila clavipes]